MEKVVFGAALLVLGTVGLGVTAYIKKHTSDYMFISAMDALARKAEEAEQKYLNEAKVEES